MTAARIDYVRTFLAGIRRRKDDPDTAQWLAAQLARALPEAPDAADLAVVRVLAALPGREAEIVARWLRKARQAEPEGEQITGGAS